MELNKITNIYDYFDALKEISLNDYFLIIAAKDTTGNYFNEKLRQKFVSLGLKVSLVGKLWCPYVAIFNNKDVVYEYCGGQNITIKCNLELDGYNVEVQSKPWQSGNLASIIIGSVQCAVNSRGLNIVVFDKRELSVVDSVCFDACFSSFKLTRKDLTATKKYYFSNKMTVEIEMLPAMNIETKQNTDLVNTENEIKYWQLYKKKGETDRNAKKRFFKGLECNDPKMIVVQKSGCILLYYLDKICKENDIHYFVSSGSLIGAVRHGGCIPWDDDIDTMMPRSELNRLIGVLEPNEEFCINPFYMSNPDRRVIRFMFKNRDVSCFIDIFTIDPVNDSSAETWKKHVSLRNELLSYTGKMKDKTEKNLQEAYEEYIAKEQSLLNPDNKTSAFIWGIEQLIYIKNAALYDYDCLFPTKTVSFGYYGTCEIPARAEDMLENVYGDIWSLPKDMHTHVSLKEDQISKMQAIIDEYEPKIKSELKYKNLDKASIENNPNINFKRNLKGTKYE